MRNRHYLIGGGLLCLVFAVSTVRAQFVNAASDEAPTEWKIAIKPAPTVTISPNAAKLNVKLPEGFMKFLVPPNTRHLLVVGGLGGKNAQLFDYSLGKVTSWNPALGFDSDAALSADGKRLALWKDDFGPKRQRTVSVGDPVAGTELARVAMPIEGRIAWAAFVAEDLLVTCTSNPGQPPKLESWEVKGGASKWKAELPKYASETIWALDPSGTYLAMLDTDQKAPTLLILETKSGRIVGRTSARVGQHPTYIALAFSPDGKRLACLANPQQHLLIQQWDFETGKRLPLLTVADLESSKTRVHHSNERQLEYLGDQYMLLLSEYVVDLSTGAWLDHMPVGEAGQTRPLPMHVLDAEQLLKVTSRTVKIEKLNTTKLASAAKVREAGGSTTDLSMPPVRDADVASAQVLTDQVPAWSVVPDPDLAKPPVRRPLQLPVGFHAGGELIIARGGGGAAIVTRSPFDRSDRPTQAALVKLIGSGEPVLLDLPTDKSTQFVAIDPDGRQVATVTDKTRIDVFNVETKTHVVGFKTDASSIQDIDFVDSKHLVVADAQLGLTCWNIENARMVWRRAGRTSRCQVTPSGKYVIANTEGQLHLMELPGGNHVGTLASSGGLNERWATSPDGTSLAATQSGKIVFWDMKSGQIARTIQLQRGAANGRLQWVDDKFLLVDRFLVSTQSECAVWQFETQGVASILHLPHERKLWYTVRRGNEPENISCVLQAFEIPEAAARTAQTRKPAPLIGPGMTVSITANLDETEKKHLMDRLTAQQIKVADNAPIRLVSSITTQGLDSIEYHITGGGKQTVQRSRTTRRIAWEHSDGKVLWETASSTETGSGSMIHLRDGQTAQDVLGKAESEARTRSFQSRDVPVPLYSDAATTCAGTTLLEASGPKLVPRPTR